MENLEDNFLKYKIGFMIGIRHQGYSDGKITNINYWYQLGYVDGYNAKNDILFSDSDVSSLADDFYFKHTTKEKQKIKL